MINTLGAVDENDAGLVPYQDATFNPPAQWTHMRITQQQTQENRHRIVHVAARLYREYGFEGIGIADVMKSAGFTHGGFYNHFASKEALAAEALKLAFEEIAEARACSGDLATFLASYLSATNRTRPGQICPAATLGADAARAPDDVKAVFADGVQDMISFIEDRLRKECHLSKTRARDRAINLAAKLTGALMLARAVPDDHPLAREILKCCLDGCLAEVRGQSSERTTG